jgi:hypothetical protein
MPLLPDFPAVGQSRSNTDTGQNAGILRGTGDSKPVSSGREAVANRAAVGTGRGLALVASVFRSAGRTGRAGPI